MSARIRLMVLFGCLATLGQASAYDGVTQVGETGQKMVAFVRDAHDELGFRGAVLAARDGKVIAAVAVGDSGGRGGEPLAVDSLFEIASCTKPFTAITVMRLAEESKLALDDPIAEHLPGIPEDCRAITVRHLLQHTSGIPGSNSSGRGKDLAKVLPTFLAGGPQTKPGERHAYWNQGYSLLSEVIARASGKSYVRYMREAVFKPAGMKSSRFTGQRPPKGILVATGQSARGAGRTAFEHPYGAYGFQYRGMGGLVTNLIDLWKWDRALAKGKLLSEASIEAMTTPGPSGYALGWRVRELEPGAVIHEHTGSVRGFLSSIRRNPSDDGCIFVLAASDDSAPFDLVKAGCEQLLAGGEAVIQDPRLVALALLEEIAGVYQGDFNRKLTIKKQGEAARAFVDWNGPVSRGYLSPLDGEKMSFSMRPPTRLKGSGKTDTIEVERDADGKVIAILFTISANDTMIRFAR